MKNFKNLFRLCLVALVVVNVTSCSDDDDVAVTPAKSTIAELAVSSPQFSTLVEALNITGLTATLNSAGSYTVFAPTNIAFETFLTANGFADVNAVPVPVLTEILRNHVVLGTNFSTNLSTGYVKTLAKGPASTTNTLSMYVEVANGAVKLNGVSTVTAADIEASNGVIHQVDAVIGLPTVVDHALANENFTTLVTALTRSDLTTDFVGILSSTGPFTVFAPTNAAFTSLLNEGLGFTTIDGIPEPTLNQALRYHVISGTNAISTEIVTPATLTTFQGQTFSLASTGGGLIITDANNRNATIIATDVQCANGIIHVLNKVLLPL